MDVKVDVNKVGPPALISVEPPQTEFLRDAIGAALCYKVSTCRYCAHLNKGWGLMVATCAQVILKVNEALHKLAPAIVSAPAKPSAATAVCVIFGMKPPHPGLLFKSVFGTGLAVFAAELGLAVFGKGRADEASMLGLLVAFLLQRMVKFKGRVDALQVFT
jgi:hypothetical protein